MEEKIRFIQFRHDGKVRVFTNKRPPVGQGPVIEETEAIKKKMVGIPYSRWRFKDGVLTAAESPIKLSAVLLKEEEPLPIVPSAVTSVELPEEEEARLLYPWLIGAAVAGGAAGYALSQYLLQ